MDVVEAVAAVICENGAVLAAQRGYGDLAGGWEFPGGKIEPGETPERALVREIREELEADVRVGRHLVTVENDNGTTLLHLHCYVCALENPRMVLVEHSAVRWVNADTIDEVGWLPADAKVVAAVKAAGLLGASAS